MKPRRVAAVVVALVAVAALVALARARSSRSAPAAAQRPAEAAASRPVPVVAAAAARRDVPVALEGLGSVVAFQTVTVRPQVDGRLQEVLFREGQPVKRGQVLAQIDPRPFQAQLHQAEGALARDEAQLANAALNLKRLQQLRAENLVAQQQVDDQAAALRQLEGVVRIDRAVVETARLNVEYARVTSPADGIAGVRLVDAGNVVRQSDANGIVVVTQLDPISVLFTLPQDELRRVNEAMAGGRPLAVEAFARDGGAALASGTLTAIDNQINQTTATIRLKATLPNERRLLWPNQFVRARIVLGVRRGALVVPATAVQRGPEGPIAYVVGADDTAAPRKVTVDGSAGDLVVVASGLAEGDRVVVDGQNQLRPGAKVAVREAAAAPRARTP